MSESLRPATLGEILDRAVHLYRARFLVFLGIAALPAGVVLLFTGAVILLFAWAGSAGSQQAANQALVGVVAIVCMTAFLFVVLPLLVGISALGAAAMTQAANSVRAGEKITIRRAIQLAWQRSWSYLWLSFLQATFLWIGPVFVAGVLIAVVAGVAAAGKDGQGAAAGALVGVLFFLTFAALAGYFLWMLLRLSLAFPVCVVERISAWAAIKRSISLSKGTRGRIFVLYLLGAVLNWIVSIALFILAAICTALIPGARSPQHSQTVGIVVLVAMYGGGFIAQTIAKPLYGIALVLFYYDQRVRQEGYDIEWLMQRAGLVVPPPPVAEAQPPTAPWLPAVADAPPTKEAASATEALTEATGESQ
jgi:hypothetical protein